MIYTIITLICLSFLIFHVVYSAVGLFKKDRFQRISALRGFKSAKALIIYIAIIPLFFIGNFYGDNNILNSIFNSIKSSLDLIVLDYSIDNISLLMSDNIFYNFTIYFSFFFVTLNVFVFTLSIISQYLWVVDKKRKFKHDKKDCLLVFGLNDKSIDIYNSNKVGNAFIVDDISAEDAEKLYMDNTFFLTSNRFENVFDFVFNTSIKYDRKFNIVINTLSDEQNIILARCITDRINNLNIEEKDKIFDKINVYVYGDSLYQSVYDSIVANGYGSIHYVNKYQRIAIDFIDKYPIAKFMDERHVDYKTSLVKNDLDINFILFGFGKTNQQIFLASIANNQFLTSTCNGEELKKVNYHIFDKYEAENNKMLNHDYYRFRDECDVVDSKNYLPLPSAPANEYYYHLNINSCDFYNRIRNILDGNNKLNFIVIAYGTDLENVDLARKIVEKKSEWKIDDLIIFVKSRKLKKEDSFITDERCYFVANESEVVYDIESVIDNDITRMAKLRNEIYNLEYDIKNYNLVPTKEVVLENEVKSNKEWYLKKSQLERESNIYCVLSLRSKLLLMGLDYRKKTGVDYIDYDKYLDVYSPNDLPDYSTHNITVKDKKVIHYPLDYKESRRKMMAVLEHYRWNSFMISKGMIPSSKEQILNEKVLKNGKMVYSNGKNYNDRRHGNLTTFDGLIDFRKMIALRDNVDEISCDVIKYDYQILDDAVWLLDKTGFEIFSK